MEEDEQVFIHPRSPYVRVDALRLNCPARVDPEGLSSQTRAPVMVFETGLPTRYYLSRTGIDFGILIPPTASPRARTRASRAATGRSGLVTPCTRDLASAYDLPTRQLLPIGMVAFCHEKVDLFVGGQRPERQEAVGRAEQPRSRVHRLLLKVRDATTVSSPRPARSVR